MDLESFSTKWFALYYSVLAVCLIGAGGYIALKKDQIANYLVAKADHKKPPALLIRILKYLFFFTLPGLVLSFTPFSWIELLFTIWSLFVVYMAGVQLVRWEQRRALIKVNQQLPNIIKKSGAIMVAVGSAIFLLAYLVITRHPIS
jgi:Flp pilus assembly protein TadB